MSEKPERFYSMAVSGREADIYIFGSILVPEWVAFDKMFGVEASRSGYDIITEIRALDVDVINVHINSPGGHVSEGLAIHNELVANKAKIVTITPGFACSVASVVFMAGEVRKMYRASMLMIHNASGGGTGTAAEHRKYADDLDAISKTSAETYRAKVKISDADLQKLLDNETWINPSDAVKWGFATEIIEEEKDARPAASAMQSIIRMLTIPQPPSKDDPLESIRSDIAAIKAAITLPAKQAEEPVLPQEADPTPPQETEPEQETKITPMNFVSALLGGKEETK